MVLHIKSIDFLNYSIHHMKQATPSILPLKHQFWKPHNFLNRTVNHIIKTSIET